MVHCRVAHVPDYSGLCRQVVHTQRCIVKCGVAHVPDYSGLCRQVVHTEVYGSLWGGSCTRLQWSLETGGSHTEMYSSLWVAHVPDYSGLCRQVVHTQRCMVHCGWLMYQITVVSVDRWFTHRGVQFTVGGSCTRL
jgi:hypothetical protein